MYAPNTVPSDTPSGLRAWLATELRRIADALNNPEASIYRLQPRGAAPARPTNGMIVYADGTAWDPGSGEGVYAYESGSWVKL